MGGGGGGGGGGGDFMPIRSVFKSNHLLLVL